MFKLTINKFVIASFTRHEMNIKGFTAVNYAPIIPISSEKRIAALLLNVDLCADSGLRRVWPFDTEINRCLTLNRMDTFSLAGVNIWSFRAVCLDSQESLRLLPRITNHSCSWLALIHREALLPPSDEPSHMPHCSWSLNTKYRRVLSVCSQNQAYSKQSVYEL